MADELLQKTKHSTIETPRETPEADLILPEVETGAETPTKDIPEKAPEKMPLPNAEKHHAARTIKPVLKPQRDQLSVKVEKILEEGLSEPFQRLSPLAREEFKLKGEETARKISELLRETHVKVKKIFALIIAWLKMLPGINHFFLEQEAKIKTDRIIALHNRGIV